MYEFRSWRGALACLHNAGWSAIEIDETCDALDEAKNDGGCELEDFNDDEIRSVLEANLLTEEIAALVTVAFARSNDDVETRGFAEALADLEAFAEDYDDDE